MEKFIIRKIYMGVSKNNGTPKSSILIGFSIINHPFWDTPIFGNTHILISPDSEPTNLGFPIAWTKNGAESNRWLTEFPALWMSPACLNTKKSVENASKKGNCWPRNDFVDIFNMKQQVYFSQPKFIINPALGWLKPMGFRQHRGLVLVRTWIPTVGASPLIRPLLGFGLDHGIPSPWKNCPTSFGRMFLVHFCQAS